MIVLVVMVGPDSDGVSVELQIVDVERSSVVASQRISGVGEPGRPATRVAAVAEVLEALPGVASVSAVGHRVTHGGDRFTAPCIITDDVLEEIRSCIPLAPMHNPSNLIGIETAMDHLSQVPHVAVFSTSFHHTMPDYAYIYGLPYQYYVRDGIRRYGFQGISHQYVSGRAAAILGRPVEDLRIISCHLGHGASITAVRGGKSIDTSMGFTPQEGLLMSTRAGDLDAAIIPLLMDRYGLGPLDAETLLNEQSGLLGVAGYGGRMEDILRARADGSYRARLAMNMYCYRACKYIGAYLAVLGGLDALVFSAGVGERSPEIRAQTLAGMEGLGFMIDPIRNVEAQGEREVIISPDGAPITVMVVPTKEGLMIAQETAAVVGRHGESTSESL